MVFEVMEARSRVIIGTGHLLYKAGLITEEQLQQALEEQRRSGKSLVSLLVELGFIKEEELFEFLHTRYGVPSIDLETVEIDPKLVELIGSETMRKHLVLPVRKVGSTLYVAMADPFEVSLIDELKFRTGLHIEALLARESEIRKAIESFLNPAEALEETLKGVEETPEIVTRYEIFDLTEAEKAQEEAPVVKLVNRLISDAIMKEASDIHIEPYEKMVRVRYRIDGILYEVARIPLRVKNAVVSRIKIMSQLDIAERRLPQDGRFLVRLGGREIDFRVSVIPVQYGEKVVLRLLDKARIRYELQALGLEDDQLEKLKKAISKPYGMILLTGPTGSGKSTTLYSILSELNRPEVNILTAEDPIEISLPGVNQVQVNEEIGLKFSTCLRAFLRQDPDIIMVGEIRDLETAEIAIRAALTGHLVFSTLHTNDAPSSINRLLDMGIEPFLISSSLIMVIAQRLVRTICPYCKEPVELPDEALLELGVSEEEIKNGFRAFRGKGCSRCDGRGYKGRTAIFEIMEVDETIRDLTLRRAPADKIREAALQAGMKTLRQSGILKVKKGITTVEEVLRVTSK
jgi:type IV pilus assembly protein PilB